MSIDAYLETKFKKDQHTAEFTKEQIVEYQKSVY